jgi:integrase
MYQSMGWKQISQPSVREQRGRWVVRVDGIDTTSGKPRPRQLGTYTSKRAAQTAATTAAASGSAGAGRGTVGWLVDRWVASRTDVAAKTRLQYEWAAGHIKAGLGRLTLDRLDREDIAGWLARLAAGGEYSRRSIQIMRTVLRAALADATDEGLIRRNPAARVPMPREVVRPTRVKEADAWDDDQVERFLAAISDHRWSAPLRLAVLYGVRRSELLALRWSDLDLRKRTVRVDEGLVEVRGQPVTSHGLRHTAATHRVRQASDAGELRAVADILGHSPDMLMRVYAHALPDSLRARRGPHR